MLHSAIKWPIRLSLAQGSDYCHCLLAQSCRQATNAGWGENITYQPAVGAHQSQQNRPIDWRIYGKDGLLLRAYVGLVQGDDAQQEERFRHRHGEVWDLHGF